jgi:putative exporter of polyketide antibiotics
MPALAEADVTAGPLLAVAAVLTAAGVAGFRRRDVGR